MRNETLRKILEKDKAELEKKLKPHLLKHKLRMQQLALLDGHEAEIAETQVVFTL